VGGKLRAPAEQLAGACSWSGALLGG